MLFIFKISEQEGYKHIMNASIEIASHYFDSAA